MKKENIYNIKSVLPKSSDPEKVDILFDGSVLVERIISTGQQSPTEGWYEQEKDEFVLLLSGAAKLEFENNEFIALSTGDYILIPAKKKHKVIFTSSNPPCVWLTIHTDNIKNNK